MIGIYMFTNKYENKSYIGQSTNIEKRYNAHKYAGENSLFHKYIRWYGFNSFDFCILEECKKSELNEKEIYYINKYNTIYPNGYNISHGGHYPKPRYLSSYNDILTIKNYLKNSDMTIPDIANMFSVSELTIKNINSGHSWFDDETEYPIRLIKRKHKEYKCVMCGAPISHHSQSGLCVECTNKNNRKVKDRPSKDELYNMLIENSFLSVAKIYGVSDNAVRKWCASYDIPKYSSYYRNLRKTS